MISLSDIIMLVEKFKIVEKIKNFFSNKPKKDTTENNKDDPEYDNEEINNTDDDQDNTPKIIIDEDIPYKDLDTRLEIYEKIVSNTPISISCVEYGNPKSPLKMIVVDDIETINSYYLNLLKQYSNKYTVDIFDKYHILLFTGEKCGYRAYNYIRNNKIRLAFLDITLNQSIKYQDGNTTYYMTMDGADIASFLSKTQPYALYMFNTGHRIANDNSILHKYLIKIKAIANKYLLQYNKLFINKDNIAIIDKVYEYLATDKYIKDTEGYIHDVIEKEG